MSKNLNLYRGDSIYNQNSNPGGFRSEGIRSGAFGGGGDPQNIEKLGALSVIKTHIDHLTRAEKNYYKITDFISFTEDEMIAKKWAADLKLGDLLTCPEPFRETRYVFHVIISESDLVPIAKGVWVYNYQCTPDKRLAYRADDLIGTFALQQAGCDVCGGVSKLHSVILIKPAIVLEDLASQSRYQRALKLAVKNDEWLLLPNDIMEQGQFRRTRIYVADFWNADLYIKKGEPTREPDSFKFK
jgi:hypothetical protein